MARRWLIAAILVLLLGAAIGSLRASGVQSGASSIEVPRAGCPSATAAPPVVYPTRALGVADALALDLPGPIAVEPTRCPSLRPMRQGTDSSLRSL